MKPSCLGPEYARQFSDDSVAAAYHARPPYPPEVIAQLADLQAQGPGRVLDLGCGTGDLTIPLAALVSRVDGVDPSAPMLSVARQRVGADSPRIRWHHSSAEEFDFHGPYDLVCAGDSVHWMEPGVVIPKIAAALAPGAFLAIAGRSRKLPDELRGSLADLIPRFSTNQEYQPYDAVDLLAHAGLFREVGRRIFVMEYQQAIADFIESLHSQNGLSRDRMSTEAAGEFDAEVERAAAACAVDGTIPMRVHGTVVWGHALTLREERAR